MLKDFEGDEQELAECGSTLTKLRGVVQVTITQAWPVGVDIGLFTNIPGDGQPTVQCDFPQPALGESGGVPAELPHFVGDRVPGLPGDHGAA